MYGFGDTTSFRLTRCLATAIALIVCSICMSAQKAVLEDVYLDPTDLTAAVNNHLDLNEDVCALVKLRFPVDDLTFEGNIVGKVENRQGEYYVYMVAGSRELIIKHRNLQPLTIDFPEHKAGKLKGGKTYIAVVTVPEELYPLVYGTESSRRPERELAASPAPVARYIREMVKLPGGKFLMGSSEFNQSAYKEEQPWREVTVGEFSIGRTEVTQDVWQAVMGDNPSVNRGDSLPVENVSWIDCQKFIEKLNEATGRTFSLPTEAEWEYAARYGDVWINFSGDERSDSLAWTVENSEGHSHAVAKLRPNASGLYDMNGNVSEWCMDWYDPAFYTYGRTNNPAGPTFGEERVRRGGSWGNFPRLCRNAFRGHRPPAHSDKYTGLRLVLRKP